MNAASRIGVERPRHSQLLNTHRRLRSALEDAQEGLDVQHVVGVLAHPYRDDSEGLAALLDDLAVSSPTELLDVMRMLTLSAGYTGLTWAGGLATPGGGRYEVLDVISTSWATIEWEGDASS